MESSVVQLHIFVSGIVQGVSYRYWTRKIAKRLKLVGWVRNMEDGRVEILLQGKKKVLEHFLNHLQKEEGPPPAKVSFIEEKWESGEEEFTSFEIRK